jgi:hypothetical protein
MPLISKSIWIQDYHGEAVEKQYYVNEKPVNPYKSAAGSAQEIRDRKVRQLGGRKIRPDELPYTWSMGYNNCVGRYSPGKKYPRFSGSSLNRNKQLSMNFDAKNIPTEADRLLKLAFKIAKDLGRNREDVPGEVSDFIIRRDSESQGIFERWLPASQDGGVIGLGVPIHVLSARSRGKIKDKATAFFRAASGDRIFCTLTFIAAVDDRAGVAILNKFLTSLRKEFKNLLFLWVAERQENGNIHFHLILNKRLPVRRWNALWVLQQYNSGLIGRDRFGDEVTMHQVTQAFEKGTVHKLFNPLDVKRVRSIGGLSMYLTKYITSQEKNVPFACSVWHCSRRVSRMFTRTAVGPSAFAYMKSPANYRVDKKTGECWPAMEKREPFFVVIYANNKSAPLKYLREMEQINKWIIGGEQVDRMPEIDDDDYRKHFCKN